MCLRGALFTFRMRRQTSHRLNSGTGGVGIRDRHIERCADSLHSCLYIQCGLPHRRNEYAPMGLLGFCAGLLLRMVRLNITLSRGIFCWRVCLSVSTKITTSVDCDASWVKTLLWIFSIVARIERVSILMIQFISSILITKQIHSQNLVIEISTVSINIYTGSTAQPIDAPRNQIPMWPNRQTK